MFVQLSCSAIVAACLFDGVSTSQGLCWSAMREKCPTGGVPQSHVQMQHVVTFAPASVLSSMLQPRRPC